MFRVTASTDDHRMCRFLLRTSPAILAVVLLDHEIDIARYCLCMILSSRSEFLSGGDPLITVRVIRVRVYSSKVFLNSLFLFDAVNHRTWRPYEALGRQMLQAQVRSSFWLESYR
jgi:hypothetical protein